jgi:hypothetical protein
VRQRTDIFGFSFFAGEHELEKVNCFTVNTTGIY